MKKCFLVLVMLSLGASPLQTQIAQGATPVISRRITERDANHEVIESVRPSSDGTILKTNHYTRLGNGINYKDESGRWLASKPVIQSFPSGIVCTGAPYQV